MLERRPLCGAASIRVGAFLGFCLSHASASQFSFLLSENKEAPSRANEPSSLLSLFQAKQDVPTGGGEEAESEGAATTGSGGEEEESVEDAAASATGGEEAEAEEGAKTAGAAAGGEEAAAADEAADDAATPTAKTGATDAEPAKKVVHSSLVSDTASYLAADTAFETSMAKILVQNSNSEPHRKSIQFVQDGAIRDSMATLLKADGNFTSTVRDLLLPAVDALLQSGEAGGTFAKLVGQIQETVSLQVANDTDFQSLVHTLVTAATIPSAAAEPASGDSKGDGSGMALLQDAPPDNAEKKGVPSSPSAAPAEDSNSVSDSAAASPEDYVPASTSEESEPYHPQATKSSAKASKAMVAVLRDSLMKVQQKKMQEARRAAETKSAQTEVVDQEEEDHAAAPAGEEADEAESAEQEDGKNSDAAPAAAPDAATTTGQTSPSSTAADVDIVAAHQKVKVLRKSKAASAEGALGEQKPVDELPTFTQSVYQELVRDGEVLAQAVGDMLVEDVSNTWLTEMGTKLAANHTFTKDLWTAISEDEVWVNSLFSESGFASERAKQLQKKLIGAAMKDHVLAKKAAVALANAKPPPPEEAGEGGNALFFLQTGSDSSRSTEADGRARLAKTTEQEKEGAISATAEEREGESTLESSNVALSTFDDADPAASTSENADGKGVDELAEAKKKIQDQFWSELSVSLLHNDDFLRQIAHFAQLNVLDRPLELAVDYRMHLATNIAKSPELISAAAAKVTGDVEGAFGDLIDSLKAQLASDEHFASNVASFLVGGTAVMGTHKGAEAGGDAAESGAGLSVPNTPTLLSKLK